MSARAALRAATAAAHDRVDAAFARFSLSERASYGEFLARHAAAILPVEAALEAAGAPGLIEQWDEHRRSALLLADLRSLGIDPSPPVAPPSISSVSELAGSLYVMEGSRLGGAVLRREVPPSLPTSFLGAPQSRGRWTRFVASLDQLLHSPERIDAAVAAALATFACFERAAAPVTVE